MPANLTPQYLAAEERYKQAKTDQEKMKALKEMYAFIPKHKGTEKLQGEIKRRISRLREEMQQKKKGGQRRFTFSVEKEGAAQVVVLGSPNTGKSQLVAQLTHASPEVADYPFTTRMFVPGMMPYENIQIQLVDLPPVSAEYMESWIPSIIKNADAALLMVDLNRDDLLDQIEFIKERLEQSKIKLIGKTQEEEIDVRISYIKTLIVGNKIDLEKAEENFEILKEFYGERFPLISISASKGIRLEELKKQLIQLLEIVRVYSKPPGKEVEFDKPFIFTRGDTLLDFARAIHKDFATKLKFARVWGTDKFDGQRINKDYVLVDGDVIELHI